MSKALNLRKPVADAVRQLAQKALAATAENLRQVSAGSNVHASRRDLKRLRSLLRLIRPGLSAPDFKTADRRLKAAGDLLAGARRMEALSLAVTRLGLPPQHEAHLQAVVVHHFASTHTPDQLAASAADALVIVESLRKSVKAWRLPRRDRSFCIEGMRSCYASARRNLRDALETGSAETLHEARKDVIHTLHHLDMLNGIWPAMMPVWVSELTQLREALGDFNDLDELQSLVRGEGEVKVVQAAFKARGAALLDVVREKSAVLFAEKPTAFARRIGAMWQEAAD